jgi:hypothetical protein
MYGASYGSSCGGCGSGGFIGQAGYQAGASGLGGETILTTDGKTYVRGADGSYYCPESAAQFSSMYGGSSIYGGHPGMYGSPYRSGVYPAGYPGSYYGPGVIPSGGIPPLSMPRVPFPQPMPNP